MPQVRPIEVIWTILERKIYKNNWEANDIDHLVRRIKQKKSKNSINKCCKTWWKKALGYMARWTIFDLLNMFFFL